MNQKGFVNIVIIIVVLIALGGVGYFVLKNQPTADQNTENTMSDQNQISTKLEIMSPQKNAAWQIGKNYNVSWKGGEGRVSLFLDDKIRESRTDVDVAILRQDDEAKKLPLEVLKGNIWHYPNLENTGSYSFSVGSDFGSVKGPFRFYIRDEKGNSAFSEFFTVTKLKTESEVKISQNWKCLPVTQGITPNPDTPIVCGYPPERCPLGQYLFVGASNEKWPDGSLKGAFTCTSEAPPPSTSR